MTEFSTTFQCRHFPQCSGCEFQKKVDAPPFYEEASKFFYPLPLPLITEKMTGWRLRAKLAVRGSKEKPKIGLFKKGSHEVVSIPDCPLHHSSINSIVQIIEKEIILHKIEPYEEATHQGILRYLQCVVSRKTGKVQLTLVVNQRDRLAQLYPFLDRIKEMPLIHSLWLNFQPLPNNQIIGPDWELYCGERLLEEEILGTNCFFHPASFSQAHLSLFENMVASIREQILPNKKTVEFYAGVGVIGLGVASKTRSLLCSEINPYAQECFEKQKELLSEEIKSKVSFISGSSEEHLHLLEEAQVVIVDPPRKGLSRVFSQALLDASQLEQCIYVSCSFASFQRDAAHFFDAGWRIVKAEAYLFFPGTNHLELLVTFSR